MHRSTLRTHPCTIHLTEKQDSNVKGNQVIIHRPILDSFICIPDSKKPRIPDRRNKNFPDSRIGFSYMRRFWRGL